MTTIDLVHIFFAKVGTLGANIVERRDELGGVNPQAKEAGAFSGSTKTWTTQLLLIELELLRLTLKP